MKIMLHICVRRTGSEVSAVDALSVVFCQRISSSNQCHLHIALVPLQGQGQSRET